MNRRLSILILLFLLTMTVCAEEPTEPPVRITTSKTHALYYMLECLIGVPRRSPEMAATFRGRVGNWEPVREALEDWKDDFDSEALASLRFPPVQGRTPELGSVLEKVSLQSKDCNDLADRAAPWIGPEAGYHFRKALLTLAPLFDKYYWPESLLERRRAEIVSDFEKGDFEESFAKAALFYKGRMPVGSQRTLALVPYVKGLSQDKVHSYGHNLGDLQVVEVVVDEESRGVAGVCFHEFLHALWSGQDAEEQQRWLAAFTQRGLVGKLAYGQLNEGLATALGNGWFQQKIAGRLDPAPWYSDPVIATYARALYPVVKPAVEQGRPPSSAELSEMVNAFEQSLPNAVQTFDVVATTFSTVSRRPEARQAGYKDGLNRLGPVRAKYTLGWEDSNDQATFTVYWLLPGEEEQLSSLGWSQPEISKLKTYALRETEQGWQLAFLGEQDELLNLLRGFQKTGLADGLSG